MGETMNDKELEDMMHHVHVLNRTENPGEISLEEFYQIVTKKLHWIKLIWKLNLLEFLYGIFLSHFILYVFVSNLNYNFTCLV